MDSMLKCISTLDIPSQYYRETARYILRLERDNGRKFNHAELKQHACAYVERKKNVVERIIERIESK